MKKYIPNFLTSLNLLFGCIGSVMAFNGNFIGVFYCVITSSIFDFLDGFSARLLRSHSSIGKDLDSLSDLISFGFVPSIMIYSFLLHNMIPYIITFPNVAFLKLAIPYLGFLLTIFSALRLAKFNNDDRQVDSFRGLPTPACALFWVSLIYTLSQSSIIIQEYVNAFLYLLLLLIFLFSYLLISELTMFSLKLKSIKISKNCSVYILVMIMFVLICLFNISGIFVGVLFYILMSLLKRYYLKYS